MMPSLPIMALTAGALGIGFAPIFAKMAVDFDRQAVGGSLLSPAAVAFWRMAIAIPFFAAPLWFKRASTPRADRAPSRFLLWLPGLVFAIDLGVWHWSFEYTSVANATVEANFAVVLVAAYSYFRYREPLRIPFVIGALLSLGGMTKLVGASLVAEGDAWIGDLMGTSVAFVYATYQLMTKSLLRCYTIAQVMACTCIGAAAFLALGAALSPGHFVPRSAEAWWSVAALALVSQVFGQGLITFGLSRVSASLAAVILILQPVFSAILGWMILGQTLSLEQAIAGAFVVVGIYLARRSV